MILVDWNDPIKIVMRAEITDYGWSFRRRLLWPLTVRINNLLIRSAHGFSFVETVPHPPRQGLDMRFDDYCQMSCDLNSRRA
jgi:hypothetical protein